MNFIVDAMNLKCDVEKWTSQVKKWSMSVTSVESISSQKHFADLQLIGIKLSTLVNGPSNSTNNYQTNGQNCFLSSHRS